MKEDFSVQVVGSFHRFTNNGKGDHQIHAIIKVTDANGPVTGLTGGNFFARIEQFDFGNMSFSAHPDAAHFPGIYTMSQVFTFSFLDVASMVGMIFCVQVHQGSKVGTGIACLSQIQLTSV